jgi:hypothetical protein
MACYTFANYEGRQVNQPKPWPERFWSKVGCAAALDCWPWLASLNSGGYGQIYIHGRPERAHRVAWELLRGEIPNGLVSDHLCRNRACVNPWHLELVSNDENIRRGLWHVTRPAPKTHCRNNHPFTPENTRIDPEGWRRCRICERKQSLAGYYRRKSKAGNT